MLLVKSNVWSYVNEYRLFGTRATQIQRHPLKMTGNYRSKIIHGRGDEGPELDDQTYDAESIVRTAVRHVAL